MYRQPEKDIRDELFQSIEGYTVTAAIYATRSGIISGVSRFLDKAKDLGLHVVANVRDGMPIDQNETVAMLRGTPKQIAMAEETLIGVLAKASGIATAAARAVALTEGKATIACGACKKMPAEIKDIVRSAIQDGGAEIRIAPIPFIYLDKNAIKMLGGTANALKAASSFADHTKVIQIRNGEEGLFAEVEAACKNGADLLMIDTGNEQDIPQVLQAVHQYGNRDRVKIAFAGNVTLDRIKPLLTYDLDTFCIGREIIDAPLLDMRLDVIDVRAAAEADAGAFALNLLEKSELWIENIIVRNVDLHAVAKAAAAVLELPEKDVLVVDVRPNNITLDLLNQTVDIRQVAGKEQALLAALGRIDGVLLTDDTYIHSNGVLGLIVLEEAETQSILKATADMAMNIEKAIAKRALVFPTGFELEQGMIEDSNSPMIAKRLKEAGYDVDIAPVLPDNKNAIARALQDAMYEGYTLLLTTGGVGAEDKDWTVEAVLSVDPSAATPWIVKYPKGTGRHVKSGVRIAVGTVGQVRIVSFPGPNDEVKVGLDVLMKHLESGFDQYSLSTQLVAALQEKIKMKHVHGHVQKSAE